ncbi:MAG TPA: PhoH family protein [Acidobacteriota bacterium]|nr:PhoH family protein [Acidobacteriota bacterium]
MRNIDLPARGAELLFDVQGETLRFLEDAFGCNIHARGNRVSVESESEEKERRLARLLREFSDLVESGEEFTNGDLQHAFEMVSEGAAATLGDFFRDVPVIRTPIREVVPRGANQTRYVRMIDSHDLVFGIGPAGTGKTYLAVAVGVQRLLNKTIQRIILARPAVEAGEKLGFLPGDLQEKVNPYLRPLYDALHHMLSGEKVNKLMERGVIEIAPLAFMRGRTLSDSFIILDEAQNCTSEQMKMFLTRIGMNSQAVVTGDITQIDLPRGQRSGLIECMDLLSRVSGIAFCTFTQKDVVRHRLVKAIIEAYDSRRSPGKDR